MHLSPRVEYTVKVCALRPLDLCFCRIFAEFIKLAVFKTAILPFSILKTASLLAVGVWIYARAGPDLMHRVIPVLICRDKVSVESLTAYESNPAKNINPAKKY